MIKLIFLSLFLSSFGIAAPKGDGEKKLVKAMSIYENCILRSALNYASISDAAPSDIASTAFVECRDFEDSVNTARSEVIQLEPSKDKLLRDMLKERLRDEAIAAVVKARLGKTK